VPYQSWISAVNSPGEGAGTALASSTTLTDISPAPQFYSQTYGAMYVGQKWRFTAYGIFSNTSTPNLIVGIYYGGAAGANPLLTSPATLATTTGASSWYWKIEAYTEIRSVGSSGTAWSQGFFYNPTSASANAVVPMSGTAQTVTVNTTTNSILTVGATWGTSSASNTITCEGFVIEQLN
jgi:hypothetical protein